MKYKIILDPTREEEVIIYAHQKNALVETIENLINKTSDLIAFNDTEAVKLEPMSVCCFVVENNKVFALTDTEKLRMKCRLYSLEETLGNNFIKINQSCIVNKNAIKRFDVSFSGSMKIILKNGYSDYISRRQLKSVKERMGL